MGWRIGVGRRRSTGRRRRTRSPGGSRIETLESRALLSATPVLVKDINPGGGAPPQTLNFLFDLTNVGGTLYFAANSDLWKSDGTAEGTVRVIHYAPSNTSTASGVFTLSAFDDLLLFGANDQGGGRKLWRSDGTPAGTFPLVGQNFIPVYIVQGDGIAFAAGVDPDPDAVNRFQVWRTDGTVAGTVLLRSSPGSFYAELPIAVVGKTVFFGAPEANGQPALWKSDGTVDGTVEVRAGVFPTGLTAFQGGVVFGDNTAGLWKSDGTAAGTVQLLSSPPMHRHFAVAGDTLYFLSQGAVQPFALWKSDGTAAGTVRLADLPGAPATIDNTFLGTDLDGVLIFPGPGPLLDGLAPWRSDGTASGTFRLSDAGFESPTGFATAAGFSFFSAYSSEHSIEPWQTDGTVAGTSMVADLNLNAGPASSNPTEWTAIGKTVFFTADDGTHGEQLWKATVEPPPVEPPPVEPPPVEPPPVEPPAVEPPPVEPPVEPPPLTGSLTPASDRGASHTDAVTNVVRPTLAGTAAPGAIVRLFARRAGQGAPRLIGHAVANATGAWVVMTIPLADGSYVITAIATAPDGRTAMARLLPSTASGLLVIDTVAPVVAGLKVEPLRGRILVTFQDLLSGMDQSTLLDRANYQFLSPYRRNRHVSVTGLATSRPAAPTIPEPVRATINGGARLKHARYVLSVSSNIRDLAGNPLDGAFNGTFPTGNGRPGTHFAALLPTNGVVAFRPRPLGPRSQRHLHRAALDRPGPFLAGRNTSAHQASLIS